MADKNPKRTALQTVEPDPLAGDRPVQPVYRPEDIDSLDYQGDLGDPGQYPYTRGIHAQMYRQRLWTMRQFSGYGTAAETNQRLKFLLEKGQTGLSVAFDTPTLLGYDSDHPRASGEVGRCGVAIDSLEDMERLFDGIPLGEVSTSMTTNAPAAILLAMYVVVAEKQGVLPERLRGTIQNDILKEYIAQKTYIFPPRPSMRIIQDILVYCTRHMPQWNTISISGYHIREAGATAVQELAFTLADGFAYVEAGIDAGLAVDEFAPRLSFFFNAQMNFFEEIAKYRAARRIWARTLRQKYGAQSERSLKMRFHAQTAGVSLTAQQPENNIVRTAIEALAAVLGGCQSLHTNSMDEALALPTEKAVEIALRTQQIVAHESGVVDVADPLGGSYYIERLTGRIEEGAGAYFKRIEALGGVVEAIEKGFFQRQIMESAYRTQQACEGGRQIIVGVNAYQTEEDEEKVAILKIDQQVELAQQERLRALRERRDNEAVRRTLAKLREAAQGKDNLMPPLFAAVRVYATLGEIVATLKETFGEYQEPSLF